jgi:hypothetical protein
MTKHNGKSKIKISIAQPDHYILGERMAVRSDSIISAGWVLVRTRGWKLG